jgi:hypothetical protein
MAVVKPCSPAILPYRSKRVLKFPHQHSIKCDLEEAWDAANQKKVPEMLHPLKTHDKALHWYLGLLLMYMEMLCVGDPGSTTSTEGTRYLVQGVIVPPQRGGLSPGGVHASTED